MNKKNKKLIMILIPSIFFLLFIILSVTSVNSNKQTESYSLSENINSDSSISSTVPSARENSNDQSNSFIPNIDVNTADYNTGITYDSLARNPDDNLGEKVTFSGTIIQVLEGDDSSQYRLAVDNNYDNVVLLEVPSSLLSSRILEKDIITIYGESQGTVDYDSSLGGKITVPSVTVDKFIITGKSE